MSKQSYPIQQYAFLKIEEDEQTTIYFPLLWIAFDPSNRHLWERQERIGDGSATCQWVQITKPEVAFLAIKIQFPNLPVDRLEVVFHLPTHAHLLQTLATSSMFGLMIEPWPIWKEHQQGHEPLLLTTDLLPLLRRGLLLPSPGNLPS
jgi:hypothetical protein